MDLDSKAILMQNMSALTEDLEVNSVIPKLMSDGILNREDVEVINHGTSSKQKAYALVDKLMKKGPRAYNAFLGSLKDAHSHLYELLTCTVVKSDFSESDVFVGESAAEEWTTFVKKLRADLKNHYRHVHGRLSPIPWIEWVQLSLENVYTAPRVTRSAQSKPFISETSRSRRLSKHISVDEMIPAKTDSYPNKILLEGDPGSGKSTTLCKLAYDWSKQKGSTGAGHNIQLYELVFLLKAADLCGTEEDLASVIASQLLPEDTDVSKTSLKSCIEAMQEKTLLIVDGYDESQGNVNGSTLEKLLQGKCLRQADVLVSSRCGYMTHLMKCFTDAYVLLGYDFSQRQEFIKKFAQELEVEGSKFTSLSESMKHDWSVKEICRNPFNLSILCLLCAEENQSLSTTRTGIITELFNFIIEKSYERLGLEKHEVDAILQPLFKVSYDALMQNQTIFEECQLKQNGCDPKKLADLGFLEKEVRLHRLRCVFYYRFPHRSFYEYFAAKHLVAVPREERKKVMKSIVRRRSFRMTCKFLFGLLKDDIEGMVDFIECCDEVLYSTACDVEFKEIGVQDVIDCHIGHLPYQALCEIDGPIPEAVKNKLVACAPKQVCFSPLCALNCVKGFLEMCKVLKDHKYNQELSQKPICVIMPMSCQTMKPDTFDEFFSKLTLSGVSSIGLLFVTAATQFKSALSELKVGDPTSLISELMVRFLGAIDEFEGIEFGSCMTSLEILGCRNGGLLVELLQGLPSGHKFRSLSISESDINGTACEILAAKLASWSELRHFKLTGHALNVVNPEKFMKLLHSLEKMDALESYSVSHLPVHLPQLIDQLEMTQDYIPQSLKTLEAILSRNPLKLMSFHHCSLVTDICTIIQKALVKMDSLERICFKACFIRDPQGFDKIIAIASRLSSLHHFEIVHVEMTDSNYASIQDLLQRCEKLVTLKISKANGSLVDCISRGLANCRNLSKLSLLNVALPDETMAHLCSVLPKLPALTIFKVSLHLENCIKEDLYHDLFHAVMVCPSLKQLGLAQMGINDEILEELCKALKTNQTITHLNLQENQVGSEGIAFLAKCLASRMLPLKLVNLINCPVNESDSAIEALQQYCSHVVISAGAVCDDRDSEHKQTESASFFPL